MTIFRLGVTYINFNRKFLTRLAILYILVIVLSSSCGTLNISDIKNPDKTRFASLTLVPTWEANDLRIDLLRQHYEKDITDSTQATEETPYHPIGFDLGNGLFYDLNKNLCLRVDHIMDFSKTDNFEVQKITRPDKNKRYIAYRFINDSLFVQYPPQRKFRYRYHIKNHHDSVAFMFNKRLKYALVENDSSFIYSGRRREWDVIGKVDSGNFYLNNKKWKQDYKIKGNEIFLENAYLISLTNNDTRIEIKSHRKNRRDRVLYTIEKNSNKLFIYNKNYAGILVEKDGNILTIYRNKTLFEKYELKSAPLDVQKK
jgi:hypothetical protein